jgi:hypothetical protein
MDDAPIVECTNNTHNRCAPIATMTQAIGRLPVRRPSPREQFTVRRPIPTKIVPPHAVRDITRSQLGPSPNQGNSFDYSLLGGSQAKNMSNLHLAYLCPLTMIRTGLGWHPLKLRAELLRRATGTTRAMRRSALQQLLQEEAQELGKPVESRWKKRSFPRRPHIQQKPTKHIALIGVSLAQRPACPNMCRTGLDCDPAADAGARYWATRA